MRRLVARLDALIAILERTFVLVVCLGLIMLVIYSGVSALRFDLGQWLAAAAFIDEHWKVALPG